MKINKIISALAASALSISLLAGCGNSGSGDTPKVVKGKNGQDLQTLRLAVMTGNLDHYASYVGVEQGIFEKYGINLEITEYAFGINTIDAIANGNADVGDMADYAAVNRLGTTLDQTNLVMFSELNGGEIGDGGLYVAPALEGKPVALLEAGRYYWNHPVTLVQEGNLECLLPVSEKNIAWYRIKDEVTMLSGDDMFYEPSPVATRKFEAVGVFNSSYCVMALVDNGRVSRTLASYSGSRFMPEIVGNYKLAPWLVTGVSMNMPVGYDEFTSSFVMVGDDALSYFPDTYREGDDVQISSNAMDADLLFFGQTHGNLDPNYTSYPAYGPGIGYALMRKKGNTEQVELYGLNFREATSYGTIYSPIRFHRTIEVVACPELVAADFYTLHQDKGILYFIKDNVLHYYDIENDRFVKDCYTFDGEVTYLKFVGNNYDRSDSWDPIQFNYTFSRLMVATCSGEEYSVYTFEENDSGNLVLRPERTFVGHGKVKKMLWYGYNPTGYLSKLSSNGYIYN